jgi:hypothetical protein
LYCRNLVIHRSKKLPQSDAVAALPKHRHIATTVEYGGDLRGIIDIATNVAMRILDPHGGPPA